MNTPVPASAESFLRLSGLVKAYDGQRVVDGIDLEIRRGEIFCLLGESGSGKTTLLRSLAGFVSLDEGRIELDGEDITDWPPHRRPLNMMFQSYALFPHLSVAANIRFGLKREGLAKAEIGARLEEVLPLLRLEHLATRKPHQLSGGQQQRVALARCLVKRPAVLLLDEPLAALDRQLRESTQLELLRLQAQLQITFVLVTHDQDEAMTMAHRIGVMRHGRLEQVAAPQEIYEAPQNRFVAQFIGTANLIDGHAQGRAENGFLKVRSAEVADHLQVAAPGEIAEGTPVTIVVRPERLRLLTAQDLIDEAFVNNAFEVRVEQRRFRGDQYAYTVRLGERLLHVTLPRSASPDDAPLPEVGERVRVAFAPQSAWVLTQ
ncbi:MAG: ABC transporter ATP-binding protein [Pseudomonadota bacterium]